MEAYVRNVLRLQDVDGSVPEFIVINKQDEFSLYELFMKLQLIQGENFYDFNTGFNLNALQQADISELNNNIINIINQYSYLGIIEHKLNIDRFTNTLVVELSIFLNKEINNSRYIETSINVIKGGKKYE